MTPSQHLLVILSEECMETAQRVTKAVRFGAEEVQPGQSLTNAQRVVYEFNDLFAVMEMLKDEGVVTGDILQPDLIQQKKDKVRKYADYSLKLGELASPLHTAKISKPQSEERVLKGEFTFENGKLNFVCHTQNVEFPEVLAAITAMRDECQRQIDNKEKCPFHKE